MSLDLLVFGPHPDDLEIGLGATIARYVALGLTVGLCDLTAGEMGSNGTVEQRLAESEAARVVLGAAWRENLHWPDRRIGSDPGHIAQAAALIRRHQPRTIALPYWSDRHPDHVAASHVLTEAAFNSGLRRYRTDDRADDKTETDAKTDAKIHRKKDGQTSNGAHEAWKPDWLCYYFINDSVAPSFVVDGSEYYEQKRAALDCHVSQFQRTAPGTADTRLNTPLFRQLIESRDAQLGALAGVRWAEGFVVREPIVRSTLQKHA